ncbi:hypothetical protein [Alkalimonas amylolytica]|uniref:Uncharacterized protein n=1 Tax=Alkalimonas amylolytica TaxID=152573 RepID=A0A1H3YFL2_ALKAM|nr:hypothetical protein [Alkalimonas amylolytica]SEA09708.1 hypothetical protein SAMN04488051_101645 [Alkalimonas amylolytica]
MKQLSRIALCLPLLMLTIEHAPEGNTYNHVNEATSQQLWAWRLAINTSSASEQDDFTGERIGVVGTRPPEMAPPGLWPGDGGGDGGGVGGGSGGGSSPTPTQPPAETKEVCLARAQTQYHTCMHPVHMQYINAVEAQCPQLVDVQLGVNAVVIFGSITAREFDTCIHTANARKDMYLNGCAINHSLQRENCLK